jgi:6-phosphogluconate dehydrogenase
MEEQSKKLSAIGVIGLAVMGSNLALNIADHGFPVSVYNRSAEKTENLLKESEELPLNGFFSIEEFVQSLVRPRKIILMVKAGAAVDSSIDQLIPLLDQGDLIIDGGNSYYQDTVRRSRRLQDEGFLYLGTGISGGEEGARFGPAIMPGGDESAYRLVENIFTSISAQVEGDPCCTYIGPDGAGHFVKMVHNGIEYADMQLISEAYSILKNLLGYKPEQLKDIFTDWSRGELSSYLIDITADIFGKKDEEGEGYLVDKILDVAGQKGTGKWTSQIALDLGVPVSTITSAVFERYISAMKEERVAASDKLGGSISSIISDQAEATELAEAVRQALYASKICSYAQGFGMMRAASEEYGWNLDLGKIAMIFRGGCIIRAQFLNRIKDAYEKNPQLANLLLDDYFQSAVEKYQQSWRRVIIKAVEAGIPVPGFSSALAYFDSYRSAELPMNLLQAQRDYFGAHTYQRVDREGVFHTEWI